ncbi:LytR/AlgR family response regulator transcription factor [Dyadobacter frigoris]|uniref:Response regulator transcription factor n=1 Tax=Dyadobacter frigoris TaxID=2576211 RepID=A0A4U6CNL2_9BACT|nr:LytTR family DNA-binding domain-containing protein [Dyadobacter frigoris]TKT85990.1 response regulator transcription factor [Dyadobacter frigoris]
MEKKKPTTMKCLIVDDEESAHIALGELIEKTPWLEHCGSCYSVMEAINMIASVQPGIIFLDVQMPEKSGLDLINMLPYPRPHFILTSAFGVYAVDGFDHQVTDFLLKPIAEDRFIKAILKTIKQETTVITLQAADEDQQQTAGDIWFPTPGKIVRLRYNEIIAIEALKDYVRVTFERGTIVTHGNIGKITTKLPEDIFIKIHRSYVINRFAVRSIERNSVTMINDQECPLAGRGAERERIVNLLMQNRKQA